MSDVTRLLDAAAAGDRRAADELLPLVYDALRRLAAERLAAEPAGQTLQPTALVHEAYLRLVGPDGAGRPWNGPGHFFAAAAEAMRRILIDQARRKHSQRRGGARRREPLGDDVPAPPTGEDLLDLDEALGKLAAADPEAAEVVKLRVFAGMTIEEVARATGTSPRTVKRNWAYARAWLGRELSDSTDTGS
jgi:RNA polymerase sigma factor (TIGR02999 family)